MRAFDISFHAYADDLQLYAEFDPRSEGDCERVLAGLSSCIDVINEWMIQNTLRLNQDKTEFFLIANRNVSAAFSHISLKLGELGPFRDLRQSRISASPLMILSLCILK